jgi:drug/metabolite transporter (DMT)-like permease
LSPVAANRRGILAMLAAMALFIANDTLVKLATATYPPGQVMAVRGVFASAFALALVLARGETRRIATIAGPVVLLRAVFEASVAVLFITTLGKLPLANLTAIMQATPIMMTACTVVLGIERVGWRRWTAILVGFAGVLLIVRPTLSGFNLYAGLALAAAALVTCRDLATRWIGDTVPTVVVTLSTTTTVALCGALLGTQEVWHPLAWREVGFLAGAAVLVTLGNIGIVMAFRGVEISVVSPFRYSIILFSIGLGLVVFDELPDAISGAGILLIVLSGVYAIHRQRVREREAAADKTFPAEAPSVLPHPIGEPAKRIELP